MSTPPIQFLSELSICQFLTMGGYTVLTYDYILTFDLEVDHIWCAPWTTVKVVFLLNRYGTLIGHFSLTLEELGILSHGSREFCANFQWFQSLLVLFSSETTRMLFLLRAWALWKCSYRVVISLVSIYGVYLLALSGYASYILFKYADYFDFLHLDETGVCVVYAAGAVAWPLGFISFLLDTVIFTVIAYYLYKLCRGSKQLQHSPLVRLLVRDAVLFYIVNVFHDVLGILALSIFEDDPRYFLEIAVSFPLLTVTGQRAVLNLRGFQSKSYATQDISRVVNKQIAAMQRRSFWQSLDLWMNDTHQELESNEELTLHRTTRTMGLHVTEEGSSYELEVIHNPLD